VCTATGSHVIDSCFDASSIDNREKLVACMAGDVVAVRRSFFGSSSSASSLTPYAHAFLGSKVASRCKLDEFIADAAAWRVRIAANSRQRQLFDEVIGAEGNKSKDLPQNKGQKLLPSKGRQKEKDEIDELFDAAGSEANVHASGSTKQVARGSHPVPIPSNCDPSVAAVLSALSGGAKKRKTK
jgi:hypothetical protein